ncbi:MAG: hypothetical protein JEZ14_21590 [Marinilabiliaceae bacterium]|nr:hypothetical protein [Marinilabiliaceae bacterium]
MKTKWENIKMKIRNYLAKLRKLFIKHLRKDFSKQETEIVRKENRNKQNTAVRFPNESKPVNNNFHLNSSEKASLTFISNTKHFASIDDFEHLPLTWSEELWLIDWISKNYNFYNNYSGDIFLEYCWNALRKFHNRKNDEKQVNTIKELAIEIAEKVRLNVNNIDLVKKEHLTEFYRNNISVKNLEANKAISAADINTIFITVRIPGIVQLDRINENLYKDLKTFMDRCSNLGNLYKAVKPILSAIPENPNLDSKYIKAILNKRKSYLSTNLQLTI